MTVECLRTTCIGGLNRKSRFSNKLIGAKNKKNRKKEIKGDIHNNFAANVRKRIQSFSAPLPFIRSPPPCSQRAKVT